jgi:hypothetical protein
MLGPLEVISTENVEVRVEGQAIKATAGQGKVQTS